METKKIYTLITGATRGMGRETAKELGQFGQHVIVGARKISDGQAVVDELSQLGIQADTVQLDVTDNESILSAAAKIEQKFGKLDILINNAGIAVDNALPSQISINNIQKEFDVNFFGVIAVTQAMLPLLKKASKAKIINISSEMGSITSALDSNSIVYHAMVVGYQSSKAALNMYSVQLAKELEMDSETSITVNMVCPGMVATEFGNIDPEVAKQMGASPVEEGVKRTIELATGDSNITATFTNASGTVPW